MSRMLAHRPGTPAKVWANLTRDRVYVITRFLSAGAPLILGDEPSDGGASACNLREDAADMDELDRSHLLHDIACLLTISDPQTRVEAINARVVHEISVRVVAGTTQTGHLGEPETRVRVVELG